MVRCATGRRRGRGDGHLVRPFLPGSGPARPAPWWARPSSGQDGRVTGDDLLGEAVSELYSADPDEFTRRRGELAARARSAGQAAVARQIAGLRKPTRSAWMVNQLVRSDPDVIARLATLGEELQAAERSGDGARMRESSQARRRLIADLVRRALAVSGQHTPPAALREEITATFGAALADPEIVKQIQHATLLRPARRVGFGTAQAPELALLPPPAGARPGRKPAAGGAAAATADAAVVESGRDRRRARPDTGQQHRPARAKAEAEPERRRAKAEAEQVLADADRTARATRQAEQEQEDGLRRLEQQVTEARRVLRDVRAQARRAETARRKALRTLDRLRE